jgi:MinD-like ATPase involved in chromosome partitioning or flagellar assembly
MTDHHWANNPDKRHRSGLVYTFYSYKGGVGRTMALANVAALLSRSSRVLVIDWDLEAPGVRGFFSIRRRYVNAD